MKRAVFAVAFLLAVGFSHQLYSVVNRAAEAREKQTNKHSMETYVAAARECHLKWPLADAFEVHQCAMDLTE